MGLVVDVRVIKGVNVAVAVELAVELALGTTVGVSGSGVKVTARVVGGRIEGVDVPGAGGVGTKVDMSASRIRTPMMMGIAY